MAQRAASREQRGNEVRKDCYPFRTNRTHVYGDKLLGICVIFFPLVGNPCTMQNIFHTNSESFVPETSLRFSKGFIYGNPLGPGVL